jgi:hypothetical protein
MRKQYSEGREDSEIVERFEPTRRLYEMVSWWQGLSEAGLRKQIGHRLLASSTNTMIMI